MKTITKLIAACLLICAVVLTNVSGSAHAVTSTWPHATNMPTNKEWTVTFSKPVDKKSISGNSVYVTNSAGEKQAIKMTYADSYKKVKIASPTAGYVYGETYTLHITEAVRNLDGKNLKEAIVKSFTIVAPDFQVATVAADGTKTITGTYPNFEEASKHIGVNQVVLLDGKVVQMPEGLVVTKPSNASEITILHEDEALKKELTYVPSNTELTYITSSAYAVKVELAGKPFFIPLANSNLMPIQTVTNRSHYYVKNGSLYHRMYSHATKSWVAAYETGKAPAFMSEGQKYYSTDSANFINEAGKPVGTAHQYFQYLPLLSKTTYSADEIDTYIMKKLQQLERDFPNDPEYKNASQRSKLIGIGKLLKQMESTYHVNALHVLGIAQNESKYGMSNHAQVNNNLFGLYVTDTNPANKKFTSIEANVKELMTAFLTKNYLPPTGMYANGTNLGNKAVGVNVKYASDPYWGLKIAGHMYRIDRDMGGRELATPADVRITNAASLKFRKDPSTTQQYAYYYKNVGMPLTVIDDQLKEAPWLKVQSDVTPHGELYVHGDFVDKLKLP